MKRVIAVENGVARHPLYRFNEPLNIQIGAGEHLAVVGGNGAGKSLLIDTLIGRYPLLMNEVIYDFHLQSPLWFLIISNISLSGILMESQMVRIITSSVGIHMIWMIFHWFGVYFLPVRMKSFAGCYMTYLTLSLCSISVSSFIKW